VEAINIQHSNTELVKQNNQENRMELYDGSNIDDAELWSSDAAHKYTLFALRAGS
jgi:hypothetical protein